MSRILVVEDDPAVRDVVEHALSQEGVQTVGVGDGEEALRRLRESDPFDLVLSVCRELWAEATHRDVPVLMLTARDDETSAADLS